MWDITSSVKKYKSSAYSKLLCNNISFGALFNNVNTHSIIEMGGRVALQNIEQFRRDSITVLITKSSTEKIQKEDCRRFEDFILNY